MGKVIELLISSRFNFKCSYAKIIYYEVLIHVSFRSEKKSYYDRILQNL